MLEGDELVASAFDVKPGDTDRAASTASLADKRDDGMLVCVCVCVHVCVHVCVCVCVCVSLSDWVKVGSKKATRQTLCSRGGGRRE